MTDLLQFIAVLTSTLFTGAAIYIMVMFAVIPFTLIAILPTNQRLLDPGLDRSSEATRRLLQKWGTLQSRLVLRKKSWQPTRGPFFQLPPMVRRVPEYRRNIVVSQPIELTVLKIRIVLSIG